MDYTEFNGEFVKQLCYRNRTFLRGYYRYDGKKAYFVVSKEGERYEMDDLMDALKKFDIVSGGIDD